MAALAERTQNGDNLRQMPNSAPFETWLRPDSQGLYCAPGDDAGGGHRGADAEAQ
jgi:hypothetical protein